MLEGISRSNGEKLIRIETTTDNIRDDFIEQEKLLRGYDERLKILEKFSVKIGAIGATIIMIVEVLHFWLKR